jgi:hypothetical protein
MSDAYDNAKQVEHDRIDKLIDDPAIIWSSPQEKEAARRAIKDMPLLQDLDDVPQAFGFPTV